MCNIRGVPLISVLFLFLNVVPKIRICGDYEITETGWNKNCILGLFLGGKNHPMTYRPLPLCEARSQCWFFPSKKKMRNVLQKEKNKNHPTIHSQDFPYLPSTHIHIHLKFYFPSTNHALKICSRVSHRVQPTNYIATDIVSLLFVVLVLWKVFF